ncbi:MAG: long-chain acyl-CoA synthetase [Halieaceae bacterium]|jgi:long-chain acyl-CoA synthetase
MKALDELCSVALSSPSGQPAIEFEKKWITWGELKRLADQVTQLIDASGAGAHVKVAFVARNRPSAIAAFLGLLAEGCSVRMVYPFQSTQALAYELERIKPAIVVADAGDYAEVILQTLKTTGSAAIALDGMNASACAGLEMTRHTQDNPGPPCIEILTSGTTGPPKPFSLRYDMIARHIVGSKDLPAQISVEDTAAPPALLMFPVSNISGLYSTLPPLLKGQRVLLLERFTVAGWHDHILRYRPPASGLPPAGVQMVLDADIPVEDLSCLKAMGTGAAPLDPAIKHAFEERYGVPILLSYGATEFGGPVTRMTPELQDTFGGKKDGSVGLALPGVKLRVIDPDSEAELPAESEGVLEVVAPRIGTHWIRTSDLVRIDDDGFLFILGRLDGAIIRGGFKLLPATIEHALLKHPDISAVAVLGIPDRRVGQVPVAAIELRPGATAPTAVQVEAHLRNHVPATHIPVAWHFTDALPRTPSMKVDQPAVRRLFEDPALK